MKKIVVIGSANMDTTHRVETFPNNLTSEGLNNILETNRVLGGKGANQAVSAALQSQGTDTQIYFIGCIGKDEAGIKILESLKEREIDYTGVRVLDKETDGRVILVDKDGNNQMFGYGDCIKELTPEIVFNEKTNQIMQDADIIIIQMKMPAETVEKVIEFCEKNGKTLIIDPTPIEKSSLLTEKGLLDKATFLTPNEEEAFALAMYEKKYTSDEIKKMYNAMLRDDILRIIEEFVGKHHNVIATLGDKGVMYYNRVIRHKKPYPTKCIDSTGAGDTFNGAFAAALSRGEDLDTAIDYALMDCANKVKYPGAQNGMQTLEETKRDLSKIQSLED